MRTAGSDNGATAPDGLNKWVRWLSFALAAAATCELMAANVILVWTGRFIWGILLMAFGWIPLYGIIWALAKHIGQLNPDNPSVSNYPQFSYEIVTVRQPRLAATIILLWFPTFAAIVGAVVCHDAVTGTIHP